MRNEGSDDDHEIRGSQSYTPVVTQDNDPVVLEMSSIDPGSPSKPNTSFKLVFPLFFPLSF